MVHAKGITCRGNEHNRNTFQEYVNLGMRLIVMSGQSAVECMRRFK